MYFRLADFEFCVRTFGSWQHLSIPPHTSVPSPQLYPLVTSNLLPHSPSLPFPFYAISRYPFFSHSTPLPFVVHTFSPSPLIPLHLSFILSYLYLFSHILFLLLSPFSPISLSSRLLPFLKFYFPFPVYIFIFSPSSFPFFSFPQILRSFPVYTFIF
jgi:hypothetical protein